MTSSLAQLPVSDLMTTPLVTVSPETSLDAVHRLLADRRISAVPVIDAAGRPLGVLSQTDLLRVGRLQPASLAGMQVLDLPADPVSEHMHRGVFTVPTDATVSAVAKVLVDRRVHRVFVEDGGVLVGAFSTEDVLVVIRGLRTETPLGSLMAKPVLTVRVHDQIGAATALLDRAHISGLAVLDTDGRPVGVFTQNEALGARDLLSSTQVDEVMSYAMLTEDVKTAVFRAAARAYETRTRRVLVLDGGKLVGIMGGLEFARVLAG